MNLLFFMLAFLLAPLTIGLAILIFVGRVYLASKRPKTQSKDEIVVGFFHPYSNAGGGGERVLWCLIRSVQQLSPKAHCVVYTGDRVSHEQQMRKITKVFGVQLLRPIEFVYLNKRDWVEASRYPRFTLLGQSLGSIVLGFEALSKLTPHIFIDSMGYAFTYPIAKLVGGCKVLAYVHYPTISTDMLSKVKNRATAHNNDPRIARSVVRSTAKLIYYKLFAAVYGFVGRFSDVTMANSSWTGGHIKQLWGLQEIKSDKSKSPLSIVYPPCSVKEFLALNNNSSENSSSSNNNNNNSDNDNNKFMNREKIILSIGQFRPEKDHALQLRSFARMLQDHPEYKNNGDISEQYNRNPGDENNLNDYDNRYPVLCLLGGCRGEDDRQRVKELQALAKELKIWNQVKWQIDADFKVVCDLLSRSLIGIHTMWNEHFGISVVEFMAAGVITLAHNSAGPKMDIVVPFEGKQTGYLAETEEEYANFMHSILLDYDSRNPRLMEIQKYARKQAQRFSEETFYADTQQCLSRLF